MTSLALYKLADEYLADVAKLADMDLPPEVIADTLEGMAGELETKATNVALFARSLDANIAAMKEAEEGISKRRKAAQARRDSLMAYLLMQMQRTGIKRIESPQLTLRLQDNPEAVEVFEPDLIPEAYMRAPAPPPPPGKAPDKVAIKEALKSGADVPGCRLTRSQRLVLA